MKKKLEAELISIAHRILKLKNKSELHQLHHEAQNLYEKLSVLMFVEEHFSEAKPTIGLADTITQIEAAFDAEEVQPEPVAEVVAEATAENEPVAIAEAEEKEAEITADHAEMQEEAAVDQEHEAAPEAEIAPEEENTEAEITAETQEESTAEEEPTAGQEEENENAVNDEEDSSDNEQVEEVPAAESNDPTDSELEKQFKPAFELSFDTKDEEIAEQIKEEIKTSPQITFDDLLGANYADPVFVKPEDLAKEKAEKENSDVIPIGRSYNDSAQVISINKDQATSINDRMSKGIIIGLNDRIAFMNHLFANSSEDYNRVLSQLMTFHTFDEAKSFIDNMVKPDYDNWEGKDEYAERFMEIVEKRFS